MISGIVMLLNTYGGVRLAGFSLLDTSLFSWGKIGLSSVSLPTVNLLAGKIIRGEASNS
jgi:hypothetical protein